MRRRKRALDSLDQDIRDHIESDVQENIERGLSPREARRQAVLRFGNVCPSQGGRTRCLDLAAA